jgi:hypothetical protein
MDPRTTDIVKYGEALVATKQSTPQRGKGTLVRDKIFEKAKGEAEKLGPMNGMEPTVCIFQYSPRRWGYGVRFYPKGGLPRIEHFRDGLVITPVWQGGKMLRVRRRGR